MMNDFEILEQKFLQYAGADRKLSIDEFQEVFDFENDFLCERLFSIFDVDKTNGVNFQEFTQGIKQAQA
ncbi:MAG: oxidoreductase, partial [Cyanobacteria bacterium P01_A01_bin.17]